MLSHYASDWKNRLRARLGYARSSNGGPGWMHTPAEERRQPQDGAFDPEGEEKHAPVLRFTKPAAHLERGLAMEPEDAGLTGSTRSLTRRLLGLNISLPKPVAKIMDGQPQAVKIAAKPVIKERRARKAPVVQTIPSAPEQAA